jgi:hypothetical protein
VQRRSSGWLSPIAKKARPKPGVRFQTKNLAEDDGSFFEGRCQRVSLRKILFLLMTSD